MHSNCALASTSIIRTGCIAAIVCLLFALSAHAQCPAGWIPLAGTPGTNGGVRDSILLPGGDLLLLGDFNEAAGQRVSAVVRYSPATGAWTPLGSGLRGSSFPYALATCALLLPNGDILVGGVFDFAGDVPASALARYRPSTNQWFGFGDGLRSDPSVNAAVTSLLFAPDGRVVVGGGFSTAGGIPASAIALLNPDTGEWAPLGSGLTDQLPETPFVGSMAISPEGDLVVAGYFQAAGGVPADSVARYRFSTGEWSPLGTGLVTFGEGGRGSANSILVSSSGDVILAGSFFIGANQQSSFLARLRANADEWEAIPGEVLISGLSYPPLNALVEMPGGDILLLGGFSHIDGIPARNIARFDPVSEQWSAIGEGLSGGRNFIETGMSATMLPDGRAVLGGNFAVAMGEPAWGVAIADLDAATATRLAPGFDSQLRTLLTLADGSLIAGGEFTLAVDARARHIAALNPVTNRWSPLGDGISGIVTTLAQLPGGDIIAGVEPEDPSSNTPTVARFDRQSQMWHTSSRHFTRNQDNVNCSLALPDGQVLFGGHFAAIGDIPASNIVRWNPQTDEWFPLQAGTSSAISDMALLPSGRVVVVGLFASAGGIESRGVATWDPQTDQWESLAGGVCGSPCAQSFVAAVTVLPNGDVVIGGQFNFAGVRGGSSGISAPNFAMYSLAQGRWISLDGAIPRRVTYVTGVEAMPDGRLLVIGSTVVDDPMNPARFAVCDTHTLDWSRLPGGNEASVKSVAFLPGGDMLVGGAFGATDMGSGAFFSRFSLGTTPPYIRSAPANTHACRASLATFSVDVAGPSPYTFAWSHDGSPIDAADNPSAATPSLVITNLSARDAGLYSCAISNNCGSVTSDPATLEVCAADFDCNGRADSDDVILFFASWDANQARADVNEDDGTDSDDVITFFAHWDSGC